MLRSRLTLRVSLRLRLHKAMTSVRLSQRLRLTPGTPLATVVSTGHIPMEPTCTHAPMAMETASFTEAVKPCGFSLRVSLRVSLRLRLHKPLTSVRLNQRLRLTPGTPLATVVSTGHIPMEPTCTHAPIAMETASFTSVRLRLILRVSLILRVRLRAKILRVVLKTYE